MTWMRFSALTLVSERQRPALRELVHLEAREWQWRQRAAAVGVAGQKRHGTDRPGDAAGRVVELPGPTGHVPGELLRPGEQAAVRVHLECQPRPRRGAHGPGAASEDQLGLADNGSINAGHERDASADAAEHP